MSLKTGTSLLLAHLQKDSGGSPHGGRAAKGRDTDGSFNHTSRLSSSQRIPDSFTHPGSPVSSLRLAFLFKAVFRPFLRDVGV